MTKLVEWSFDCGCGERITVEVERQSTHEKSREVAFEICRSKFNWVSADPSHTCLSCSPRCWNRYHEEIYKERKEFFYPWWWEESPNGRQKHGGEMPPCTCPPHYVTVFMQDDLGIRSRKVKLLDGWHHEDGCWWRNRA